MTPQPVLNQQVVCFEQHTTTTTLRENTVDFPLLCFEHKERAMHQQNPAKKLRIQRQILLLLCKVKNRHLSFVFLLFEFVVHHYKTGGWRRSSKPPKRWFDALCKPFCPSLSRTAAFDRIHMQRNRSSADPAISPFPLDSPFSLRCLVTVPHSTFVHPYIPITFNSKGREGHFVLSPNVSWTSCRESPHFKKLLSFWWTWWKRHQCNYTLPTYGRKY